LRKLGSEAGGVQRFIAAGWGMCTGLMTKLTPKTRPVL